MKKIKYLRQKFENQVFIKREQLKSITGGFYAACTASCGGGVVVTCTGELCHANDNSGCYGSDSGELNCPNHR